MAKAFRAGLWIAAVGVALMAQGCWDDQPDGFTLIGEGGCRTADGGDGQADYAPDLTMEQCEAKCLADGDRCVAFEYNANNNGCEVHRQAITSVAEVEGVSCYAVK